MGCAAPAFAQAPPQGYIPLEQYGAPPDTAGQPVEVPKVFEVVRGASLRATLERWAKESGWQPLSWGLPEATDFTLGADGQFSGDFITATRSFVNSLGSEAKLRVQFNQGNRLVVVEPL